MELELFLMMEIIIDVDDVFLVVTIIGRRRMIIGGDCAASW